MGAEEKSIAIVGGGASGLAAAIGAVWAWRAQGNDPAALTVRVFEADERVGRSILATGNGRCNFSNARPTADRYHNGSFMMEALRQLDERSADIPPLAQHDFAADRTPVMRFFSSLGLAWREDEEGRLWPLTNKASSVLDVLRNCCAANGVEERCGCRVVKLVPPNGDTGRFTLYLEDGRLERADAVILAVGHHGVAQLLPEGVVVLPYQPVLGPLAVKERWVRKLENIRVRCGLALQRNGAETAREVGELQFRKYGISGICVFNLSRHANPGDIIAIDFLPETAEAECVGFLRERLRQLEGSLGEVPNWGRFLDGLLLPRVAEVLLDAAGINPDQVVFPEDLPRFAPLLKALPLTVTGIADKAQCQVCRGGIAVTEVDPSTMQLRRQPGLFATGEALDIDADCGGYNLTAAWTTALLAGVSAVR